MPDEPAPSESPESGSPATTTSLSRKWLLKMVIFMVALAGLGAWGAYDAWVAYPARGERHARFMLRDYLAAMRDAGRLTNASVPDPVSELERLRTEGAETEAEAARLAWLTSLSRIYNLRVVANQNASGDEPSTEPRTVFENPRQRLNDLETELQNQNVPSGLNAYDIPFQYLLVVLGFAGGALAMLVFLGRVATKKYRWDPGEKRLTLPDGRSFTPEQIKSVDKRDWHKYFIHLTVEGEGFNGELKLDLLRFVPLEEWVLEMERLHPNYEPPEDEGGPESVSSMAPDKGEPLGEGSGEGAERPPEQS